MSEKTSNGSGGIRSIERALKVLTCFDWQNQTLSTTEIAKKIGLAKSTTSRILSTLENEGFLFRDETTSQYQLGHQIYYLGMLAQKDFDIREVSHPIMKAIRDKTQETVSLYLLENYQRICVAQVESERSIKQSSVIGESLPIWLGASGKSMLAFLEGEAWKQAAKEVKPLTPKTIVKESELFKELSTIKDRYFAVSEGERYDEVSCVSAPIFGRDHKVVGSLSISSPYYRFPKDTRDYSRLVIEGAREISEKMGHRWK
ncbi:MAG: hypothetical protein AVO33_00600 [delta proteobacterium ML8_F1]|nr:MAG: hypothetical protein AVO33_00600 [delta proteobacterium ML8_F1]